MPFLAGNGIVPTAGLNALAAYAASGGLVTYIALGTGAGPLGGGGLVSGTLYGSGTYSLPLANALPAGMTTANYPKVRLTDSNGHSQDLTLAANASAGDTHLTVSAFTANANYAAATTVVTPEPAAGVVALYAEQLRIAVDQMDGTVASLGDGENAVYFDPTQPTGIYCELAGFGGVASGTPNSGTLMFLDWSQYWAHVNNMDSATFSYDQIFVQA